MSELRARSGEDAPIYESAQERPQKYTLQAFRVRNYKAFVDTDWVDLKRWTVVYGGNSAGKTALFHLFSFMKRCYRSSKSGVTITDTTQLGGLEGAYSDIRNQSAGKDQEVEFSLRFKDDVGEKVDYHIVLKKAEKGTGAVVDKVRILRKGKTIHPLEQGFRIHNMFFLESNGVETKSGENYATISAIQSAMGELMENLQILGANRYIPDREMILSGADQGGFGEMGDAGQNVYAFLYQSAALKSQGAMKPVNDWLHRFGYSYDWLEKDGREQFLLTNLKTKKSTNIVDNGYGIGQSLPIAVAVAALRSGQFLFLDSPEAHLQTAMQAELADLLQEADEGGYLILETGSENLLLRLRRRIAEGSIRGEEVALYFVEEEDGNSQIRHIRVDSYGDVYDAPDAFLNFFSSDYEDMIRIQEAKRKGKIEKK